MNPLRFKYISSWCFVTAIAVLFAVSLLLSIETYRQYLERQQQKALHVMVMKLLEAQNISSCDGQHQTDSWIFSSDLSSTPKYNNIIWLNWQNLKMIQPDQMYRHLEENLSQYLGHGILANYYLSVCFSDLSQQKNCLNFTFKGGAHKYLLLLTLIFLVLLISLLLIFIVFTQRMTHALLHIAYIAKKLKLPLNVRVHSFAPLNIYHARTLMIDVLNELEKSLHNQTQMLAAISHDIKTPLTKAGLYLEPLLSDTQHNKIQSYFDDIRYMSDQILRYTRQVHDQETKQWIDLYDLIESECMDYQFYGHNIVLTSDLNEPVFVCSQRKALKRAMSNVIDNAFKYASALQVNLYRQAQYLRLEFVDNGSGVPEEVLHKLSQPFYRVDHARTAHQGQIKGVGLGLSIVATILQANDIKLEITNSTQGGLSICFIWRYHLPA
ncbi:MULTISPECIES: sensor histidine kinase [Cysteiniphilum]|uniref:sensor histidine kinase n=1 Tax=Cysteiniphilum TaxID=2056696 RepID=UPI00177EE775|nr:MULTISPECIES: HAMP domain-containing sensor histidine kinase [Cysteiniphilum]